MIQYKPREGKEREEKTKNNRHRGGGREGWEYKIKTIMWEK